MIWALVTFATFKKYKFKNLPPFFLFLHVMKIAAIKEQELFEYLIRMMMSGSALVALARVFVLNEILFASLRNTKYPDSIYTSY